MFARFICFSPCSSSSSSTFPFSFAFWVQQRRNIVIWWLLRIQTTERNVHDLTFRLNAITSHIWRSIHIIYSPQISAEFGLGYSYSFMSMQPIESKNKNRINILSATNINSKFIISERIEEWKMKYFVRIRNWWGASETDRLQLSREYERQYIGIV